MSNVITQQIPVNRVIKVSTRTGMQGPPGVLSGNLEDVTNVDKTGLIDGSTLVYDVTTSMWVAQNFLIDTVIDGGTY